MRTTNLNVGRLYTNPKNRAYDQLKWVKRDALIENPITDQVVFEQKGVEFPESWSLNAVNIVAQKYFTGEPNSKERESSLKDLIDRVVDTITRQGITENYFDSESEAEIFQEELKYILATQRAAFNSPTWFNIGDPNKTQLASASFILNVEDTMDSIFDWYREEGAIFKQGSGSGVNLSAIRSSVEPLGRGIVKASGPLSFMRGANAAAGAIESFSTIRRAVNMRILNADHPDIEEFIWSKAIEAKKARLLKEAGFDTEIDTKDSFSVHYQNASHAVRVTDEFMQAVENDDSWDLKAVKNGDIVKTVSARSLMKDLAKSAWECADPSIQYDTTINEWHTTPNQGRINGSNPTGEYMHLDDSACNLASINLMKYLREDGSFDILSFKHTIELIFTAQEILVGYSDYPTKSIAKNSRSYREIGLGYTNLGALLMAQGLPYDSDEGRAQAAAITALMTGHAYATSAKIARKVGPFSGFHKDQKGMLRILKKHREEVDKINPTLVSEELLSAAASAWDEANDLAAINGVRNSQASALAPTGTIGLIMDCDTTGIEPNLNLTKLKKSADGESTDTVNRTVLRALKVLGYKNEEIAEIVQYIDVEKTIIGAPYIKKEHEKVFACSIGTNLVHYFGHLKMMSAVQPFISGSISKTINMPEDASIDDVRQLYVDAWKSGLKAVSVYKDNSTQAQSLFSTDDQDKDNQVGEQSDYKKEPIVVKGPIRREMPKTRTARTFEFSVSGSKGFITVGEYEDGSPGEIFIKIAKQGSTLSGVMESLAISVSYGLQYGVPLKSYVHALTNMTFAPAGLTDDSEVRTATSLVDYIFKRLAHTYLSFDDLLELGLASIDDMPEEQTVLLEEESPEQRPLEKDAPTDDSPEPLNQKNRSDSVVKDDNAPMCYNCGNQTQRSGTCYVCTSCGSTTGCS